MEFKIPNKFQLGGVDFKIKYVPHLTSSTGMGQCNIINAEIEIADSDKGITQSDSVKVNTFFHELTHCILDTMGEYELSQNEKFVCTFSSLLTGALRTME